MKRLFTVSMLFAAASLFLAAKLGSLINDDEIAAASAGNGSYTIRSVGEYGGIYDCNMIPLVNRSEKYDAVVIPNNDNAIRIQPYILDWDTYYSGISGRLPFLCGVDPAVLSLDDDTVVFRSMQRTGSDCLAPHIVGYTSDNTGMYGIEKAYDELLRSDYSVNSVSFGVDALGGVLGGLDAGVQYAEHIKSGVVITIDSEIQRICENAAESLGISKGAVIVMDVSSGEIKAALSCPDFDPENLSASMNNASSPFVNRVFSAYSVGSIFKLVTAAAALEQGISSEYSYVCTGSSDVYGQVFNCHKWGGHGEIDMCEAMVGSCNTYFIALSEYIDNEKYIDTASALGFGKAAELCSGMVSDAGNLQTAQDIAVAAERANMSFGQGKLTATPLQICRMTAAIANDGVISEPVLIKGLLNENGEMTYSGISPSERVLSYKTARKLKYFMIRTVRAENSMSKPGKTAAAGKTSTAQTGRFDSTGNEIMNCWFTGYFPSYSPKYAVTVLTEGGVSGNYTAGPVFKKIADDITEYEKSLQD